MDNEIITWLFLIGGVLLMIAEALLPGGVAFFLGLSGLGVGILRFLGLLSDPVTAMMVWLFSSVGLTIAIRPFIKKYFKGESSFKIADEDYEVLDKVVDVVEPISDENNQGRIRLNGITWNARTVEGTIAAGEKARISYRISTTWIVEPLNPDEHLLDQKLKEITD